MEYDDPKTADPISGVEHLADLERIMSLFEEIWPKILFLIPMLNPITISCKMSMPKA